MGSVRFGFYAMPGSAELQTSNWGVFLQLLLVTETT